MKEEKEVNKTIEGIKLFFVLLIGFATPLWEIREILFDFAVISCEILWYWVAICANILSFVVTAIVLSRRSFSQKMKTSVWLAAHTKSIVLCYALPVITLVSLKSEINVSISDLRDIISISWTVFAIIITVFFVWQVLIPKYLRKKATHLESDVLGEGYKKMQEKTLFYERASIYFVSPDLVKITLAVLVIATTAAYMTTKGVTLFNLNAVRCSFFYCMTTIVLLLIDVLQPTKEEEADILSKVKVSAEEIERQAQQEENRKEALKLINLIDQMDNLSEKEKQRMKMAICSQFFVEHKNT